MKVGDRVRLTKDIENIAESGSIHEILTKDGDMVWVTGGFWVYSDECVQFDGSEQIGNKHCEPTMEELKKRRDKAMTKAIGF